MPDFRCGAALLGRGLDIVLAHQLAPAFDLAAQQPLCGLRRTLVPAVRCDAGVGPGFEDRGIVHHLRQRGDSLEIDETPCVENGAARSAMINVADPEYRL
jgi:hypothetical protein